MDADRVRLNSSTEAIIMEADMDNRILTTRKVVVDMSRYPVTHTIKMAGQGVMEDGSNTDKVRINPTRALSWFLIA